jgi:1-deoxy-D-xylulose-5-phosphate reductoisomerase
MKTRNISVIGATGSVGRSVLNVCSLFPDLFRVRALAAEKNVEGLFELGRKFKSDLLVLTDRESSERLRRMAQPEFTCLGGEEALLSMVEEPHCEEVVFASSGTGALPPLISAVQKGKKVYLANKEIIVAAGEWIMPMTKGDLIPLDSEHNAVWQCLRGEAASAVRRIYLTASGGPFLHTPMEDLREVSFERASRHPIWPMGKKISIDSATLMNKGIEMIEAHHLFGLPIEKIEAVIHPQALVHGMVEFIDGSVKMLYSRSDMRLAILSAFGVGGRLGNPDPNLAPPELTGLALEFMEPDEGKFPCLAIAREACRLGGAYPPILIGADEGAVMLFKEGRIGFTEIGPTIEGALTAFNGGRPRSWQDALGLVAWGKERVLRV